MPNTKKQFKNQKNSLPAKGTILDQLVVKKFALDLEIKGAFLKGLQEACRSHPDIQSIILYRFAVEDQDDFGFINILAFRPKKESKALIELAENFKFDRDLEYACIPMIVPKSDKKGLSTTKTFNTERKVKEVIKPYQDLNEYLEEVFDLFAEHLDLELSFGDSLNANIFKLT